MPRHEKAFECFLAANMKAMNRLFIALLNQFQNVICSVVWQLISNYINPFPMDIQYFKRKLRNYLFDFEEIQ